MKVDIRTMEGLLRGKCLPAKMLVNESLAEYLVRQFDALHERAGAAERERDELRESLAVIDGHLSASRALKQLWKNRAWDAEEEIARRDAAAKELGAQPQNPVILPLPEVAKFGRDHLKAYAQGEVLAALNVANIAYEVKK